MIPKNKEQGAKKIKVKNGNKNEQKGSKFV